MCEVIRHSTGKLYFYYNWRRMKKIEKKKKPTKVLRYGRGEKKKQSIAPNISEQLVGLYTTNQPAFF